MAIDHILFDKQNWYSIAENSDNATANGKEYYAVPSTITIKQGTDLTYPSGAGEDGTITETVQDDSEVNCVGANANHYFFTGFIGNGSGQYDDAHVASYNFQEEEGCGVGEVLKTDCKNVVW